MLDRSFRLDFKKILLYGFMCLYKSKMPKCRQPSCPLFSLRKLLFAGSHAYQVFQHMLRSGCWISSLQSDAPPFPAKVSRWDKISLNESIQSSLHWPTSFWSLTRLNLCLFLYCMLIPMLILLFTDFKEQFRSFGNGSWWLKASLLVQNHSYWKCKHSQMINSWKL